MAWKKRSVFIVRFLLPRKQLSVCAYLHYIGSKGCKKQHLRAYPTAKTVPIGSHAQGRVKTVQSRYEVWVSNPRGTLEDLPTEDAS